MLGVSLAFVTLVVAILQLRQGKRRRDHERRGNEANINAASRNGQLKPIQSRSLPDVVVDAEGPDTSLAGPVDDLGHAMNALPPTRPIRNVDQSADMAAGSNFDASLTGKTFASSTTPIAERTDQDLTMVTPAV